MTEILSRHVVMVVDGHQSTVDLLRDILEYEGSACLCAHDPAEALALAHRTRPDIVLIDLLLADGSGIALAEALRNECGQETRLVGMSASRSVADIARASNLFDEVVAKPFDLDAVLAAVEAVPVQV